MALMLTLRVSSQFHLILRMNSRICLCQTLFAFLVTLHTLTTDVRSDNTNTTTRERIQRSTTYKLIELSLLACKVFLTQTFNLNGNLIPTVDCPGNRDQVYSQC
ncbi:conserved hypothetical protein [Trichinella spiralis]|uniref:hypothetical protein n=1 Tax=Trichinella spiralis TaxID=6334 RepID=UPI0001EFCAB5|nr:conserved hypothetical protein [Trichinella spiralis]